MGRPRSVPGMGPGPRPCFAVSLGAPCSAAGLRGVPAEPGCRRLPPSPERGRVSPAAGRRPRGQRRSAGAVGGVSPRVGWGWGRGAAAPRSVPFRPVPPRAPPAALGCSLERFPSVTPPRTGCIPYKDICVSGFPSPAVPLRAGGGTPRPPLLAPPAGLPPPRRPPPAPRRGSLPRQAAAGGARSGPGGGARQARGKRLPRGRGRRVPSDVVGRV